MMLRTVVAVYVANVLYLRIEIRHVRTAQESRTASIGVCCVLWLIDLRPPGFSQVLPCFSPSLLCRCPLQLRVLFHCAHKTNDEAKLMQYHQSLSTATEDQLSLASIHFQRSHYQVRGGSLQPGVKAVGR